MDNKENILEALNFIDPASLSYTDWLRVGLYLKQEGFSCAVWDDWSHSDKRYKEPAHWNVQRMWRTDKIHQREEKEGVLLGQMQNEVVERTYGQRKTPKQLRREMQALRRRVRHFRELQKSLLLP